MPTTTRLLTVLTVTVSIAACSFEPATPGDAVALVDADPRRVDGADSTSTADAACPGGDGDRDGVADSCDPCPNDAANDADADGVCGDVDDWPCGARPSLPTVPTWTNGAVELVTVGHADIEGGGPFRVVTPGEALDVTAGYSIIDCNCTGCIDQIQIGLVDADDDGGKQACLYSGNPQGGQGFPQCSTPTGGVQTVPITAPATPGRHDLRFRRGNDNSCGTTTAWWDDVVPDANTTFGVLCVR